MEVVKRVDCRAAVAQDPLTRLVSKHPQQDLHGEAADDAEAQDPDHCQVTPPKLVWTGGRVGRPAGVERIGSHDTAQVSEARNKSAGGGNTDLTVAGLEDLVGPGHTDRHRGAQAEAHHEEAAVTGPLVVEGEGHGEQARDLDEYRGREEDGPELVEAVTDRRDDEDSEEVHDPYGRKQQADLDIGVVWVDGCDDDVSVELRPDADTHDAKVHHDQWPESPVDEDIAEVLPRPWARVVHPLEIVVVHKGVLTLESLRCCGEVLHKALLDALFARRKRAVRKPPEQHHAQDDGEGAPDDEHPLEPDDPSQAVHLLEPSTHETHDSGRDLRGAEVHADALPGPSRRVEQCQVITHARPHPGDDEAQQEAQELDTPGGLDGGEAHADGAHGKHDPGHPDARAELAHDEAGWAVKDDIGDVEQGQGGGCVVGGQV